MLVFAEHFRIRDPRHVLRELTASLTEINARPAGIARHAALVGAFVEASELAQGLADAEAVTSGFDARRLVGDLAMSVVVAIARDIAASWTSAFTHAPVVPPQLAAFATVPLPAFVRMRRAEGHAFYAVYPEAYLVAAAAARAARPGPRRVIGIRSNGTGLAAIVAAAMDAPLPITVRPNPGPYRRKMAIAPQLLEEWTADPDVTLSIVDEGPGLSGGSFGVIGEALEDHGLRRIECFPSHAGELGPLASERLGAWWARVPRTVVDVDTLLVHTDSAPHALATWITDLVGPLTAPLEDLSAGAWRHLRFPDERRWPPSVTFQERRKWLARTASGTWIAKFVGLGRAGEHALARARSLHASRFTAEIAGLRHGFLIERWLGDTRNLDPRTYRRTALVDHVGSYLGFRARSFPASERGATLTKLLEMLRRNVTAALGAAAATRVDRWNPHVASLERMIRPVEIDGRLHAWEWLVRGDQTLIKADALDHHAAHDLIGCQDITWDIAGATVELGLTPAEEKRLMLIVGEVASRALDPDLLTLTRACYLAFQLGRHALAIDTADRGEAHRLQITVDRYARLLRDAL